MTPQATILVVDDTPEMLKLLVEVLTAEGYQVLSADSGERALAAVAAQPPELILLDIRMPGMDGFELYRRLKAQAESCGIPIVFLSGSVDSAGRVDACKLGAVDFIGKPFHPEELLARIHTHLELGRLRFQLQQQAADLRRVNEQLQSELAERERSAAALATFAQEMQASRSAALNLMNDAVEASHRLETANQELRHEIAERQRAERQSAAFSALGRNLSAVASLEEAAHVIVALADELLGWDACTFDLCAAQEDTVLSVLVIDTISGRRVELPPMYSHTQPPPLLRKAIEAGAQLVLRPSPLAFSADLRPFGDATRPSASLMFVPVRDGSKVVGVLSIQSYTPGAYDQKALDTLQALADHCGGAVERIQVQDKLRESEVRYRALVETTCDWVWEVNAQGRYTFASSRIQDLLGYAPGEVVGRTPFDLMPEAEARRVAAVFAEIAAERRPFTALENTNLHKDGRLVVLETSGGPVFGPGGEYKGYRGMDRDITERKRAEEALGREQNLLRTLVNLLPTLIFVKDREGRFLLANAACARYMGVASPQELLGQTDAEFYPPETAAGFRFDELRVLQGIPVVDKEEESVSPSGNRRILLTAKVPLRGGDGSLIGLVGTSLDITERKQAEAALHASEERFRRAVVDSPFPILLHAEDGAVLQASNSWCEITGYTREELATIADWTERAFGERKALVRADIDRLYGLDHRVAEGDYTIRTKDGSTRIWEFSSAPLGRLADGRRLVISMAMDVTGRRQAEADVRALNAELERRVATRTAELETANHELAAFSYSVSHDLRSPLRGIDGWSQALLEDYAPRLDERGREYLRTVRAEAQRMGQLIDDLLRLSRVTRAEMEREAVDLSELARGLAEELRRGEPARVVEMVIAPGTTAVGDPKLLRIALQNLLANAWKFTAKQAQARIEFGAAPREGQLVFFVRDDGAGFDMRFARKLFGPFQRLHKASEFPGTGVGLATVQRIIHRHGGRIWAEAAVDQGATFYFTLPPL
jgi:PAS domain S-box-containing protein